MPKLTSTEWQEFLQYPQTQALLKHLYEEAQRIAEEVADEIESRVTKPDYNPAVLIGRLAMLVGERNALITMEARIERLRLESQSKEE